MFCTKCGKQLHDGDRFCAYCGAKVRDEVTGEVQQASKYEEVVFNPPFRQEAERRTKQITEESPYSTEPKRETVHFDWNLDGFPSRDHRKDDDFELNWEEVIERRRDPRPVKVEKIVPAAGSKETVSEDENKKELSDEMADHAQEKEETLSIADLERELFGSDALSSMNGDEKGVTIEYSRSGIPEGKQQFYTYNAKRDAFQELIDKEKERIRAMDSQIKNEWEEIAPREAQMKEVKEPPAFEDVFEEPATPLVPPVKEVAVVMAPLTMAVEADEELIEKDEKDTAANDGIQKKTEQSVPESDAVILDVMPENKKEDMTAEHTDSGDEKDEKKEDTDMKDSETKEENESKDNSQPTESQQIPAEEEKPEEKSFSPSANEKTKLRYSDVFPADAFGDDTDGSGNGGNDVSDTQKKTDGDEEDDEKEEYKGSKILKVIIAVLAVVVAVELIIIGTKAFFPDSGFTRAVDGIMTKITSVFTGEEESAGEAETSQIGKNAYMHQYVSEAAGSADNIGSVAYKEDLTYDLDKTYAFEEIKNTKEFTDKAAEFSDDADMTYGKAIVEAVVGYYNGWQERNKDENLIGINSLDIGEIRTGENRFYVMARIVYASGDGGTVSVLQTVSLTKTDNGIIVDEVKEESV